MEFELPKQDQAFYVEGVLGDPSYKPLFGKKESGLIGRVCVVWRVKQLVIFCGATDLHHKCGRQLV